MRSTTKLFMVFSGMVTGASAQGAYEGSRYQDVWSVVEESPYEVLPQEKVTLKSFYTGLTDNLQKASERTLNTGDDILPPFRKLLHPNGVCMAGTWNITEETPYSGYFRQGSQGLIILRGSSALTAVKRGEKRSFGIAGKIFPTLDPQGEDPVKTANFFVIDNLGGTYAPSFFDTAMTNDITAVNFGPENLGQTGILAAAVKAFGFAEPMLKKLLTVRQLYPISELGEPSDATVITPQWLKIEGRKGFRSLEEDFRAEVLDTQLNEEIVFDISVASAGLLGLEKPWKKIGFIRIDQAIASDGCDHRLHFAHPKWRNDLKH